MEEKWIDVRDYERLYQVSNLARVRSVDRWVETKNQHGKCVKYIKGKVRRQSPNNYGYLTVQLRKNGVPDNKLVHVLVAEAFIPNPNNYDIVHHKDHNQKNNRVENLEWISKEEHDAMHANERGEQRSKTVYQYTLDGLLVNVWKNAYEAARVLGFCHVNVSACCNGGYHDKSRPNNWHKAETYKGYRWSYEPL